MRALGLVALLALACTRPAREPKVASDPLEPLSWAASSAYDALGAQRTVAGCSSGCAAVLSYRVLRDHPLHRELGGRSFVYDDALAMLVHLSEGRYARAEAIGHTLIALQNSDRSIGFSFDFADPAFVDSGYVRAGVVAWAGYALATYDVVTGTNTFRDAARSYADGLLAARFTEGPRSGLVAAGRGRWLEQSTVFDRDFVADYAVTEHQIDVYFLLRALDALDPGGPYGKAARDLARDLVRAAWVEDERMFAAGVDRDGATEDRALDSAGGWGALFLLASGDQVRAYQSLLVTNAMFRRNVNGFVGYAPYVGRVPDYPDRDLSQTFFSEGTAAMGVLFARVHFDDNARGVATTLGQLRAQYGGAVPYAFPASPDFPDLPAVAPTAWLRLLERELETSSPIVFAAPRVSP